MTAKKQPNAQISKPKSLDKVVKRIPTPSPPLAKLAPYQSIMSKSKTNGVFLLSKLAPRPAHDNRLGPMGWDTKNFPVGGANFDGLIGFQVIWDAKVAFIVYAEASKETEASWMAPNVHPVADKTLTGFLLKLYKASFSHKNPRVKKIAAAVVKDLELDYKFIKTINNEFKKNGKISAINEDTLAMTLNNPKRYPTA